MNKEQRRLLAELLAGLSVPASLRLLGAALKPWVKLRQAFNCFGYENADEIEAKINAVLGPTPGQADQLHLIADIIWQHRDQDKQTWYAGRLAATAIVEHLARTVTIPVSDEAVRVVRAMGACPARSEDLINAHERRKLAAAYAVDVVLPLAGLLARAQHTTTPVGGA